MIAERSTIVTENLVKRFGEFTAVDEVSFTVHPGEIFGFLGPNGSGKTTTIRMMLGLLTPTSGNVEVLGVPVLEQPEAIRSRVGYMSQRFSLYNDLTVLQNLRFYGTAYGLNNKDLDQQIDRALQMAGLEGRENVRTHELSGGWRQRLALGAAILHEPEVLFLDEPTAGVDPLSRRDFWELLYQLVADGVTVFVTTHYMDEAEHCHRLALLQRGQIIASGSPDEMRNQGMHGQVLEIVSSDSARAVKVLRAAKMEGRLPLESVELYGSLVHVIAEGVESLQDALALELERSEIESGRMAVIEPSLEDVFIAYMRD
ncbi:MAG: ABC transporter ATP-binding protein [Anaerolineales bacterium]|nr:MAG: ABC transporter ATP-binding protein [Anaerolineales bacterium]